MNADDRRAMLEGALASLGRPDPGWLGAVVAAKMSNVECSPAEFLALCEADDGRAGYFIAAAYPEGRGYTCRIAWPGAPAEQTSLL